MHEDRDYQRNDRNKVVLEAISAKAKTMEAEELATIIDYVLAENMITTNMTDSEIMEFCEEMTHEVTATYEWPFNYTETASPYAEEDDNDDFFVMADTLESNVAELHKELFGQEDYQVGEFVKDTDAKLADLK
jgi:anionic cell wall polymer biosynthesis LytR-Cps2A-Psr (LCP) family protein